MLIYAGGKQFLLFSNSKTDINVALGPPHHWVAFGFLREGCVTQHDGICLSHGRKHVHH